MLEMASHHGVSCAAMVLAGNISLTETKRHTEKNALIQQPQGIDHCLGRPPASMFIPTAPLVFKVPGVRVLPSKRLSTTTHKERTFRAVPLNRFDIRAANLAQGHSGTKTFFLAVVLDLVAPSILGTRRNETAASPARTGIVLRLF